MGRSADAYIFYGIVYKEDEAPEEVLWDPDYWKKDDEDYEEWEDRYLKAIGFTLTRVDGDLYYEKRRELLDACPCTIGKYGYADGYSMPYVAVKDSHQVAWEYGPQELDTNKMVPRRGYADLLQEFCKLMGIDLTNYKVSWYLVANYG